jgi:hypothetical protein
MYYMFTILQAKVASDFDGTPFDDNRFKEKFERLYLKMRHMDGFKYLHPRFSMCFEDLTDSLGITDGLYRYKGRRVNKKTNRSGVRVGFIELFQIFQHVHQRILNIS